MKGWRNLGELVECKTCLATVPKVFGLTFGMIKEDLEPIQTWAFDEFRWSRGQTWHTDLESLTTSLDHTAGLATCDFPDAVRTTNPRNIMDPMKALLLGCLQAPARPQMNGLWALHRARRIPAGPAARNTSIRRGIAKLLVFEDLDLGARIHDGVRVPKREVPFYAIELGIAQKSTREAWGVDPDIKSAVQCLGRTEVVSLARTSMQPRMDEWYYTLRNHSLVPHLATYIQANYANLCRPQWLRDRMLELFNDPRALVSQPSTMIDWPPPTVWLFELIMQLVRLATGSANGYGYAELGREVVSRFNLRLLTG